ncbi:hypothetical protein [Pedobacter gandavensis]|uniref:hypothetical protein n=1 Tax=Pedobacter gandavensis TaxID=2679963 RepID=UPI00292FD8B6|nr:hypothetical protein [Pedobacter gandavensis]
MYAELFHFFVAIGLFIGSFIFYFIFVYFKSIQKLRWLFGSLAVYGAVIAIGNSDLDVFFVNLVSSSRLPKEYNEYQDLKQPVVPFENKEMKLVIDGNTDLEHYLTTKNQLIVAEVKDVKPGTEAIRQKEYSKFDSLGNFMAKYKPANPYEILFEGYLINVDENYYRTWPLDGDTSKRKIETQNADFSFDANKQADFIASFEGKATFLFSKQCWTTGRTSKKYTKTVFRENDKWKAFYNDTKVGRTVESLGNVRNDLFRYYSREDYKLVPNDIESIQYQYFQRIKLKRSDSGSENWDGYLFTNVIDGRDTLKIKEALIMGKDWEIKQAQLKGEFSRYFFYSNPNLRYQLFTNDPAKLYFIKNK